MMPNIWLFAQIFIRNGTKCSWVSLKIIYHVYFILNYCPPTNLWEGNVFTGVCHSVGGSPCDHYPLDITVQGPQPCPPSRHGTLWRRPFQTSGGHRSTVGKRVVCILFLYFHIFIHNIFHYHYSWNFYCKCICNHIPINDSVQGIWLANVNR